MKMTICTDIMFNKSVKTSIRKAQRKRLNKDILILSLRYSRFQEEHFMHKATTMMMKSGS